MLPVDLTAGSNRSFTFQESDSKNLTVTQEEAVKIATWLGTAEKKSTGCSIFY